MKLTTLCYIEKDDSYLMLHRTKKADDLSKDMWIGVGGHFEQGESPNECLIREVKEETGLTLTSFRLRGIVTFLYSDGQLEVEEYMFLYTADGFEGKMMECDEGELRFIKKDRLNELYFWTGDEIFLKLIREDYPVFDLKLQYAGRTLKKAVLDGRELELFDVLDEHFQPSGIVRERNIVHELGSWHRTVHIWVVRRKNSDREIHESESAQKELIQKELIQKENKEEIDNNGYEVLLQKRAMNKDSYPGCYDISSAGHMRAGDDYLDSALRELEEELGITAQENELQLIGTHKGESASVFYGKPFINNEYSYVYLYDATGLKDSDISLQYEEVESVLWVDYEKGRKMLENGSIRNCVFMDEWDMIGKYLGNTKRKEE